MPESKHNVNKKCSGCKQHLAASEFYGYDSRCKKCVARRNKTFLPQYQARTRAVLDAYKLSRGCRDCGYREHAVALDFDHLPGYEKNDNLSTMVKRNAPLSVILEEITKCEVVCSNCHRVRTAARRVDITRAA